MKFEPIDAPFIDNSWGAVSGKYSFVIGYIKDHGYSASFKDREYTGPQSSSHIENSLRIPFKTLQSAEAACRRKLKELKRH